MVQARLSACLALSGEIRPVGGITLRFGSEEVKIVGGSLHVDVRQGVRLFAGIVRRRVPWIQQADQAAAMAAGMGAVVTDSNQLK